MLILARRKWWLMLAVIVADVVIALTVADTLIRWEVELMKDAWYGE